MVMALVKCVHCEATNSAPPRLAGKRVRCGRCKGVITAPRGDGKFEHPPGLPDAPPPVPRVRFILGPEVRIIIGTLAACAAVLVLALIASLAAKQTTRQGMADINARVAADAVEQYEIAKRHGSPPDIYVHAGLVAAAYLQAKDEANYQKWRQIQDDDGRRAGLPKGMR